MMQVLVGFEGGGDGAETGEGSFAAEDFKGEVERGAERCEAEGDADKAEEFGGLLAGFGEQVVQGDLERVGGPIAGGEFLDGEVEQACEFGFGESFEEFVVAEHIEVDDGVGKEIIGH